MNTEPIVVEKTFDAPINKVWQAITNRDQMEQWYFKLKEFKPELGFIFEFTGGPEDGIQYLHHCEITEVIPGKKLSHNWKYIGYPGESFVTWELLDDAEQTQLKLTHTGLETFPAENADFSKKNFAEGWNYIVNTSLVNFLKNY